MCGDEGGLANCGCLGICGHFRLQYLPSGERLQYLGLVGKLQHSGNGLRKASSYKIRRPNSRPKTHADQVPGPCLEGRSATLPKPTPRQSPGAPVSNWTLLSTPLALVYLQNLAL